MTTAAMFIEDETEFDAILTREAVMVVDFTAVWCGPCKLVAPMMDRLANEYGDRAKVFKLDLDANPSMAKRFGISSIPVVLFFKQGELLEKLVGVRAYEDFSEVLQRAL
ncbi:MAG: thioredoxin [Alkalinema sp. RU_4_3]|nr:thioredoxin [Alkalinema sp. RU_4_3]